MLRKRAATNARRLITGQAQGSDLDTLYLDLAELGELPPILRDLRDFVAHRGARNQGHHHNWVSAIVESARFIYAQTASLSLDENDVANVLKSRALVASRVSPKPNASEYVGRAKRIIRTVEGWDPKTGLKWAKRPTARDRKFSDQLLGKMDIPNLFDPDDLARQMLKRISDQDVMNTGLGDEVYEPVKRRLALHAAATLHGAVVVAKDRPDITLRLDMRSPISIAAIGELKPHHLHPVGQWSFTFHVFNTNISTKEGSTLGEPPPSDKVTLANADWPLEFRNEMIMPMDVPPSAWVKEYAAHSRQKNTDHSSSSGSLGKSILLSMTDKNGHFE
ncbi:hypothetical protein [uncultured Erythrobacter sp.]|uniref:hypothetical protein n=1 Tax=uncultured Erythrobacter sp. TaxID=263913 RepID=UPI00260DB48F|nr:hypothetical protein [uncultured Erythrobacter sp.]